MNKSLVSKIAIFSLGFSLLSGLSSGIAGASAVSLNDSTTQCALDVPASSVTADASTVSITAVGIYCVAEFKAVGTYSITIPATTPEVDYLIVAGGGGGASGGGGGGGVLQGTNYLVTPGSTLAIAVGAGGAGGNGGNTITGVAGGKGGNSSIDTLIAKGGGGGSSSMTINGDGGSGGGAAWDCMDLTCTKTKGPAGTGTPGQGNNGGYSTYPSYGAGGGGGGGGGAGFNTVRLNIGANGGVGISSSITGAEKFYAGGGGGGVNDNTGLYVGLDSSNNLVRTASTTPQTTGGGQGGIGGGGRGSSFGYTADSTRGQFANATSGVANTGGGGGGTDPEDINAGSGGSGVVVIRWVSAANMRTITFNSNHGTVTTASQFVVTGTSTTLSRSTFVRANFIFTGWNTAADGTGTAYTDSSNISVTANTTLYAQWVAGANRVATFSANSGSGTMANQEAGLAANLITNTFTRTGHKFVGWNTSANGSGYAYADGASYSFDTDVTLYAQWEPVGTQHTVSFYANGATSGSTPSQTSDVSAQLNLNGFDRSGYSFLGWNTTYNAPSASYIDAQNYSFADDLNLYAIWVPQSTNTITFDGNTSTGGTTASQTASIKTLLNANGFTKDGYTFTGWNTKIDGTGTSYSSGYYYSFATSITLYAKWGKNISVSYNGNGSDAGSVPTNQNSYLGGAKISPAANTGALKRAGYTLAGWNTAANGNGTSYGLGGSPASFTADTILYAQWTGAAITVTYSGNTNTAGIVPPIQSFANGSAGVQIRDNIDLLVKTGFTFNGWNTAANGSSASYAAGSTYNSPLSITLYAQWKANLVETTTVVVETKTVVVETKTVLFPYAISFEANGGTGTMAGLTGAGASIKLTPNSFKQVGFTFIGWKDDAGVSYIDGQNLTLTLVTSLALHAQWSKDAVVQQTPVILTDKIISISPVSGYANDQITITGEFNHIITSITVDGLLLPVNSWAQTKTTVSFAAPGHAPGVVEIKLSTGLTPELPAQKFEYLQLAKLGKEIGITGVTCLGTFDVACVMKPGAAQPVSFKVGSNALSAKSIKTLKSWKLETAKSVIVYGYASKSGTKAANLKLTKKRAAEVGAWVKKNWPNLSVKTVGLGTVTNRLCKPYDNKCAMIKIVTLKK